MIGKSFSPPYLLIQRQRLGLEKAHIEAALRILDQPWEMVRERAGKLLQTRFGLSGQDPFEWLKQQPIQSRREVRRSMSKLSPAEARKMERRRTSGSSGTPMQFFRNREMSAWMDATAIALYSWHGQRPWDRQARFWGTPLTVSGRIRQVFKDRVLGRRRFGAYRVSNATCERHFRTLLRFKPKHVYGYPSLIHEFVTRCQAMGLDGHDLGAGVVFTTGEPLFPEIRTRAKDFFGCQIVNEYGCTEAGILAFECKAGTQHATPVASWFESVDQSGKESTHGSPGTAVTTDLVGVGPAFKRYELGDLVTMTPGLRCECGRDLPKVDIAAGRTNSFIVMPNGDMVYNAILGLLAPKEVLKLRGQQTTPSTLLVTVELESGVSVASVLREYEASLEHALGKELAIAVEAVEEIPREPSGKLRYFIPLSEGGVAGVPEE